MIKALIFDVNGVLTHAQFSQAYEAFAHKIHLPDSIVASYLVKDLEKQLLGQRHIHDIYVDLSDSLGGMSENTFKEQWVQTVTEITTINEELLKRIDSWRTTYTCGILTNNTEGRGIFDEQIKLHTHFDFVLESYKEHIKKPDPLYFQRGLQHAKCQPDEAVYVDDQQRHVGAATSLGMHGIVFTDNAQLKRDLVPYGVIL